MQLIRSEDLPAANRTASRAVVRILWPLQPSIIDPKQFPDAAAGIVRMFASASTEVASIRTRERHCEEPGDGRCGLVEVPAAAEPHPMSLRR